MEKGYTGSVSSSFPGLETPQPSVQSVAKLLKSNETPPKIGIQTVLWHLNIFLVVSISLSIKYLVLCPLTQS